MNNERKICFGAMQELPYSAEEALNRLRINMNFQGQDIRKIMVISSTENEGKSFVAMQLWRQMAEKGENTLFIDADLRKSVNVDRYNMTASDGSELQGTTYYLSGGKKPEEVIYRTTYENGDMLPNVNNIINPSLLIENQKFKELMDYAGEHYRYTFVDCPPLGEVSDGEQIAAFCDGAILCVRAGETPKALVRNSVRQLERAGCPLLGIVLNRASAGTGGYYHKYYGKKYYGYGDKYYGQ